MKTLYLFRHAKSSWKHPDLKDFDRPLNKRGKRDAPFMGQLLKEKGIHPDLIVSSPANRALTTAQTVAAALDYPAQKMLRDPGIYHASEQILMGILRKMPYTINSVMLFGHNPGFTWLSNLLTDTHLDNIPTAGVVQISFPCKEWKALAPGHGTLDWFEYPKKHFT